MISCTTRGCPTTGIYIPTIEETIIDALKEWNMQYSAPDMPEVEHHDPAQSAREALVRQLDSLNKQLNKMYDLVEQGVYTPAVFIQRSGEVKERIADAQRQLNAIQSKPSTAEIIKSQLPQIRYVMEAYPLTDDLQQKNALLKSVISKVVYHKTKHCTRADNPAEFMQLDIYPTVKG